MANRASLEKANLIISALIVSAVPPVNRKAFARLRFAVAAAEPADGGVIIVGSRVADTIPLDAGQLKVGVADFKLQDFHAGYLVAMPQRVHLRGNQAQVFRHNRQAAERISQRIEKLIAGPGFPDAVSRSSRFDRYCPVSFESAEVINSDQVRHCRRIGAVGRSTTDSHSQHDNPKHTADYPTVVRPR